MEDRKFQKFVLGLHATTNDLKPNRKAVEPESTIECNSSRDLRHYVMNGIEPSTSAQFAVENASEGDGSKNQKILSVNISTEEEPLTAVVLDHIEGMNLVPTASVASDDSSTYDLDIKKSIYLQHILTQQRSMRAIMADTWLMKMLYNTFPEVGPRDLVSRMKEVKNMCMREKSWHCSYCGSLLGGPEKECTNLRCKLSGVIPKRGRFSNGLMIKFAVEPQIRHLLKVYMPGILDSHRSIHDKKKLFNSGEYITDSFIYREYIETKAQFENYEVTCLYTIFVDGAKHKRISRQEITPIVLRIECIEGLSKDSQYEMIIAAIHRSPGGMKRGHTNYAFNRLINELDSLNLTICQDCVSWKVKLRLLSVVSDMKALNGICQLPNWLNPMGCSTCKTVGQKFGSHISFNSILQAPERHRMQCLNDITKGQNGFEKLFLVTTRLFTPEDAIHDVFHIYPEGIYKSIMEGFRGALTWEWSRIRRGRLDAVTDAMNSVKGYTQGISIPNIESCSSATGSELEQSCIVAAPLAAFNNIFVDPSYGFFVIAHSVFAQVKKNYLQLDVLKSILLLALRLHKLKQPDRVTLKHHVACHHIVDQIKQFGYGYDGREFEKLHSTMQNLLHFRATNAISDMVVRYIILGQEKRVSHRAVEKKSEFLAKCEDEIIGSKRTNDESKTRELMSFFPKEELKEEHLQVLLKNNIDPSNIKMSKRASLPSSSRERYKTFSSESYWKRAQKTKQDIARVRMNGSSFFVKFHLFYEIDSQLFCIAEKFITIPFNSLCQTIDLSSETAEVKRICYDLNAQFSCLNYGFEQISSSETAILLLNDISCSPATVVKFERRKYVVELL